MCSSYINVVNFIFQIKSKYIQVWKRVTNAKLLPKFELFYSWLADDILGGKEGKKLESRGTSGEVGWIRDLTQVCYVSGEEFCYQTQKTHMSKQQYFIFL